MPGGLTQQFPSDDMPMDEWLRQRNRQLGDDPSLDDADQSDAALGRALPVPFSAPDPDAGPWDDMVAQSRLLQARDDAAAGDDQGIRMAAATPTQQPVTAGGGQARQVAGGAIDPSRTDVFQRGADGKLHPINGWHTTGPFDAGAWAHNIDWPGVLRDLVKIASRSVGGAGVPGLVSGRGVAGVVGGGLTTADKLTLGAGAVATGDAALDSVAPKARPPHQ